MFRRLQSWVAFATFASVLPLLTVGSNNLANAVSSNPTPNCSAGSTCTVTFAYTGDYYAWTVPAGITYVDFDVRGAQGSASVNKSGGLGGRVTGRLTVTSGTTYYIYVGGQAGWNGGGNASSLGGGKGGGGSDIRTSANTNYSGRLVVAGGGGGAGVSLSNADGGAGGGLTGQDKTGRATAYGGSQTAGGAGGSGAAAGTFGIGGNAEWYGGAGGGGGGWYGGGGGGTDYPAHNDNDDDPGAGGSSYTDPNLVTSVAHTQGYTSGNGQISITYLNAPTVTGFTSSQSSPTNTSSSISFALSFSQNVNTVAASDFSNAGTATGCTFTPNASSGSSFTLSITDCSEGTLIPQVGANQVFGTVTNSNGPTETSVATTTIRIDRTSPAIASISPPISTIYGPNTQLNFTVNFSESVTVSGTPRLPLTVGSTQRYATFVSMTDSKTATFRYTVQTSANDIDTDGVSLTSPAELNGGSIADLATNSISSLSYSLPSLTGVKVAQLAAAPTITGITPGETTLTVSFTAGSDNGSAITNYQYSTNGGSNFTAFSPVDTTTPLIISGLTNNNTYSVKIRALTTLNGSSTPGESSTTVSATTSARPVNTVAPSISGTISIGQTLNANTGTWSNSPTSYGYQWVRSQTVSGTYTPISGATANAYTIQSSDNSYFIKLVVQAINSQGSTYETSSATAQVKVPITISGGSDITTTPGVIESSTAFTASGGYGSINLTVTPVNPEISINNGIVVAGAALPAGSYTETVTATDSLGDTATTTLNISVLNVVNAPAFTVGRGSGTGAFKINFTPVTGAASYTVKVYRSNDSFASVAATITNYVSGTDIRDGDPRTSCNAMTPICFGVKNGNTFRFTLTPVASNGYTSSGESAKSDKHGIFRPIGASTSSRTFGDEGFFVTNSSPSTNAGNSGVIATAYASASNYTVAVDTASIVGSSANSFPLPGGETYTVTLIHLGATVGDTVWFDSDESDASFPIFVLNKPNAPSNISAVRAGSESIRISWTRASGPYQTYYYHVSTDGVNWGTSRGNTTSDSATITGLVNGTTYYVRVNAFGSETFARASDYVIMSGTITPAGAPGPVSTYGSSMSSSRINLTWTAPSITGGSAITSYLIEFSSGSATYGESRTALSSDTSLALTGLTNGLRYYVRIKPVNEVGAGDASEFGGGSGILVQGTAGSTVGAVTSITRTSATISATINARGNTTTPTLTWGLVGGTQTDVALSSVTSDNVSVSSSITGLLPGRRYQVTSSTSPGVSEDVGGRPIYFTTTPDSVTGVSATTTTSSITISWTFDAGGNGYSFSYDAIAQLNGVQVGSGCTNITAASGGRSSCEFTGLDANTSYTFSITASITGGDYGNGTSEAYVLTASTDPNIATITLTVNGGNLTLQRGSTINIVAATNVAGRVTFRLNGRTIKTCKNKSTSSLSVTCVWRPSVHGSAQLSALFNPTSNLYTNVTSRPTSVNVVRRTGTRG